MIRPRCGGMTRAVNMICIGQHPTDTWPTASIQKVSVSTSLWSLIFYIYEKCAKPHPSSSRNQIFLTLLSDKRNCKQLFERKQGSLGVLLRSLAKNLGYLKISLNVIRVKAGKESHTEKFLKTRRGS